MSGKPIYKTLSDCFWSKVERGDDNECWVWKGVIRQPDGYGAASFRKVHYLSHRLSYMVNVGEIPDGLCVLHSCDNRPCCNPNHLRVGTRYDNYQDAVSRNRTVVGSKQHMAKLTEDKVVEIRRRFATGKYTQVELGEEYGVLGSTIGHVVRGNTWRHVK